MNRDFDRTHVVDIASGANGKRDILKIVALTTLCLDGLRDGLPVCDAYRERRNTQCVAVHR